jgi:anti-sigma B factor antagonist
VRRAARAKSFGPIPVGHELLARLGDAGRITVARPNERTTIFDLAGAIHYANSPQLRHELRYAAAEEPAVLVINLTHVDAIDSAGVAVLLDALGRVKRYGGRLRLVGVGQRIRAVMAVCQVADVFEILDSEQEAIAP